MTMGSGKGFEVQYSDDGNEVYIIPMIAVPFDDLLLLCDYYIHKGYKWWLPSDHRCGYRFVKELPDGKIEAP